MSLQIPQGRNMLHLFKRHNISAYAINEYLKSNPATNRRVGSLPVDWFKNLSSEEFSSATDKADTAFCIFSKDMENQPAFEELSTKLVNTLQEIFCRNDIKIDFAGQGAFKYCQKLTVGDYSYALSTFKPRDKFHYYALYPKHGQCAEPQKIFWAYKNSSHGRVAKPFMARFCAREDEGGYILSKFIDLNDKNRYKSKLNPLRERFYPLFNEDNVAGKNYINEVCIDIGGIDENHNESVKKMSSEFRRNLYTFLDRINIEKQSRNIKTRKSAEQLLLEEIKNGENIYTMDLRTLESKAPFETAREAVRIVRRMRAVHNLKANLVSKCQFEEYEKYLRKFSGYFSKLLHYEIEGLL